jgi:hypothetical protein
MGVEVHPIGRVALRPGGVLRARVGGRADWLSSLAEVTVVGFAIGATIAIAIGQVPELAVVAAVLVIFLFTSLETLGPSRRRR